MSPVVLTEKKPKEGEEDLNPRKRRHRALKIVLKKELAVECIKPKSTRSVPSIHISRSLPNSEEKMSPVVLTEKKPKEGEKDLNPKKRRHQALKKLAVECIKPKSTSSIPIHKRLSERRPKFEPKFLSTRANEALIPIKIDYATDNYAPGRIIVSLYARLGLHRFNFLEGKDLRVSSITVFTKTTYSAASAYKITFKAKDPSDAETLFQARVNELAYGGFVLVSPKSGPHPVKSKKYLKGTGNVLCGNTLSRFMPTLSPEENPFQDDTGRFRLLKKSEVLKNEWIHLYLELAVATTNRQHIKHGVANLKLLKVAMEITRDLKPCHRGLGAYDAIFYIRYKDTCKGRAGDGVERVALVRRIVDVHSGVFRIVGRTQSFQTITPPASDGIAAMEASAQD